MHVAFVRLIAIKIFNLSAALVTMIIISVPMFMVLSSLHGHCKSSPGSCDRCSTALGGRRRLDQADQPEPIDPPVVTTFTIAVYYYDYSSIQLILILPSITVPRRVEG